MVRPLAAFVEAENDLARLGWLKLTDDETIEYQIDDDAPLSHEQCLPFESLSTDGGAYSPEHGNSAAVNVIAKYAGRGSCTIESVTIRTPTEGYNSPVAQAIVFASLGVPSLEKLVSFDEVRNEHDFEQEVVRWSQQAQMTPCMPKPVALVSMRGRCNVTMLAVIPRSCKYAVIKLLRPRGSGDNIDVEYVGLHGCRQQRLAEASPAAAMPRVQSHKVKLVGVDGQEQAVILDIETEGVHLLSQKAQHLERFPFEVIVKWLPSTLRTQNPGTADCFDIQLKTPKGPRELRVKADSEKQAKKILKQLEATVQDLVDKRKAIAAKQQEGGKGNIADSNVNSAQPGNGLHPATLQHAAPSDMFSIQPSMLVLEADSTHKRPSGLTMVKGAKSPLGKAPPISDKHSTRVPSASLGQRQDMSVNSNPTARQSSLSSASGVPGMDVAAVSPKQRREISPAELALARQASGKPSASMVSDVDTGSMSMFASSPRQRRDPLPAELAGGGAAFGMPAEGDDSAGNRQRRDSSPAQLAFTNQLPVSTQGGMLGQDQDDDIPRLKSFSGASTESELTSKAAKQKQKQKRDPSPLSRMGSSLLRPFTKGLSKLRTSRSSDKDGKLQAQSRTASQSDSLASRATSASTLDSSVPSRFNSLSLQPRIQTAQGAKAAAGRSESFSTEDDEFSYDFSQTESWPAAGQRNTASASAAAVSQPRSATTSSAKPEAAVSKDSKTGSGTNTELLLGADASGVSGQFADSGLDKSRDSFVEAGKFRPQLSRAERPQLAIATASVYSPLEVGLATSPTMRASANGEATLKAASAGGSGGQASSSGGSAAGQKTLGQMASSLVSGAAEQGPDSLSADSLSSASSAESSEFDILEAAPYQSPHNRSTVAHAVQTEAASPHRTDSAQSRAEQYSVQVSGYSTSPILGPASSQVKQSGDGDHSIKAILGSAPSQAGGATRPTLAAAVNQASAAVSLSQQPHENSAGIGQVSAQARVTSPRKGFSDKPILAVYSRRPSADEEATQEVTASTRKQQQASDDAMQAKVNMLEEVVRQLSHDLKLSEAQQNASSSSSIAAKEDVVQSKKGSPATQREVQALSARVAELGGENEQLQWQLQSAQSKLSQAEVTAQQLQHNQPDRPTTSQQLDAGPV
ncbi:MAG: hypothetical protein FRX49_06540 [Trebouxia sp. A1-2]|nr:MAG: hypothetical protein FRX49_06540 [Trebouxia sp. A1-2]